MLGKLSWQRDGQPNNKITYVQTNGCDETFLVDYNINSNKIRYGT